MRLLRYMAEGLLLILLAAFAWMGRANVTIVVIFAILLIFLEVNDKLWKKAELGYIGAAVLLAVAAWTYNDLMAIGKITATSGVIGVLNFFLYLMPIVFCVGLFKRSMLALLVPEVVFLVIGLANAIIKAIRRTPISAGDIFSVKTAMAVAGNYSMEFGTEFILKTGASLGILGLATLIICLLLYVRRTKKPLLSKVCRITLTVISCVWLLVLVCTSWIISVGGKNPDYFSHETNGFAYNLYLQLKDLKIQEPECYSQDMMQEFLTEYPSDQANAEAEYPNIIVVMNESFADLSVLGEYETNQEVLPFLNSLEEDTVKGTLYASVYGGNTANSEYEFLTGSSIAYFSERVVPFQLYMNEDRDSVISQMNSLGYDTMFIHPYRAYSWNRPSVYTALGVDEMYYEEDMTELEYIRAYGSDASQNRYIIQALEEDTRENPLFLYDVTVQNHGGYTGEITELTDKITIAGHEGEYTEVENYLTLAHESDKALEELVTYLKNYEEPTVLLFFGDHQPAIESEFIEMAASKSQSEFTLEDRQSMYQVPFFLWANYDIVEREVEQISINYLSTFLCTELGLPMTGFQKFLADLYEEFPVINSVGVVDRANQHINLYDLQGEQLEKMQRYYAIIYNFMFDTEGRAEGFYSLIQYKR